MRTDGRKVRLQQREEWSEVFRNAPIGVLVLGFLLLVLGAGLILGGAVFAFSGGPRSWPIWVVLFGAGPLAIYVALEFVSGRSWAWLAVVAMLVMSAAASGVRVFDAAVFPIAPLAEIALSLAAVAYLMRPHVRQAFGR
jgi:hypothetical protein